MTHLLDTNVISEWVKPRPDPNVVAWMTVVDEDQVYLSAISFAKIRRGVELLPAGTRREQLASWLADDLPQRFEGRILSVDRAVAEAWGTVMARARHAGIGLGAMDAFFAATARVHDLTLVTRNTRDFRQLGIAVVDPWTPQAPE